MKNIRMKREELLRLVRENQTKHIAAYLESVEDFKKLVLTIAVENLKIAKTSDLTKFGKIKNTPSTPVSYESDYARSIRMLELSIDDIIEIEEGLFKQLVLDEWHWKNSFTLTGAMYKAGLN